MVGRSDPARRYSNVLDESRITVNSQVVAKTVAIFSPERLTRECPSGARYSLASLYLRKSNKSVSEGRGLQFNPGHWLKNKAPQGALLFLSNNIM